jgi:tellurite resistance protein TehA-like permease
MLALQNLNTKTKREILTIFLKAVCYAVISVYICKYLVWKKVFKKEPLLFKL